MHKVYLGRYVTSFPARYDNGMRARRSRADNLTMNKTYRVKVFMLGECAWRVVPFVSLRDACSWRSECERRGWLATLMEPAPMAPLDYMGRE